MTSPMVPFGETILPKHDGTEFTTHVACRANEPLFIHGRSGK